MTEQRNGVTTSHRPASPGGGHCYHDEVYHNMTRSAPHSGLLKDKLERAAWRALRVALRILLVTLNNLYAIPAHCLLMAVLWPLLRRRYPHVYWQVERVLFGWLLTMVAFWISSADYAVQESGADISVLAGEPAVLLINHQGTGDVPFVMYAMCDKGSVLNDCWWIMDAMFKYTNFGLVSQFHQDFFITQGRAVRDAQLRRLSSAISHDYAPLQRKWIMLFPEGGFRYKRLDTSKRYALKHGYPSLDYVTLPRVGALHTILTTLSPSTLLHSPSKLLKPNTQPTDEADAADNASIQNAQRDEKNDSDSAGNAAPYVPPIKWVIDVTIGYPSNQPIGIDAIFAGSLEPCTTGFHYRVYPTSEIPTDETQLTEWIYARWVEKEALLKHFYSTGEFPSKCDDTSESAADDIPRAHRPRKVHIDNQCVLYIHMFFVCLSFIFYRFVYSVGWILYTLFDFL